MSSLCHRTGAAGLILAAALSSIPESSLAGIAKCGERGASNRRVSAQTGALELSVRPYDSISWRNVAGKGSLRIDYGDGYIKVGAKGRFVAPKGVGTFRVKVKGKGAKALVTCTKGAPLPNGGGVGVTSANSQTGATGAGIALNVKSRLGTGGGLSDKRFLFTSSKGDGSDWNAWATLESRGYSGGITGWSGDLVGGADLAIGSGFLVGLLAGLGRTDVIDSGSDESSVSPMLGGYFGANARALLIEGFASAALPVFSTNGASYAARRQNAGLNVTARLNSGRVQFEPFLSARGYREQHPSYTTGGGLVVAANTVSSYTTTLGLRIRAGEANGRALVPYFSAATEYKRELSTLSGASTLISPRIGFGLKGHLGAARVSVDVDIGRTRADTIDRGVKMGYELKF